MRFEVVRRVMLRHVVPHIHIYQSTRVHDGRLHLLDRDHFIPNPFAMQYFARGFRPRSLNFILILQSSYLLTQYALEILTPSRDERKTAPYLKTQQYSCNKWFCCLFDDLEC
jgi:hypothetical protein